MIDVLDHHGEGLDGGFLDVDDILGRSSKRAKELPPEYWAHCCQQEAMRRDLRLKNWIKKWKTTTFNPNTFRLWTVLVPGQSSSPPDLPSHSRPFHPECRVLIKQFWRNPVTHSIVYLISNSSTCSITANVTSGGISEPSAINWAQSILLAAIFLSKVVIITYILYFIFHIYFYNS